MLPPPLPPKKYVHVAPIPLTGLHWLQVKLRINFKISLSILRTPFSRLRGGRPGLALRRFSSGWYRSGRPGAGPQYPSELATHPLYRRYRSLELPAGGRRRCAVSTL